VRHGTAPAVSLGVLRRDCVSDELLTHVQRTHVAHRRLDNPAGKARHLMTPASRTAPLIDPTLSMLH
jgi:hypothetical protein